MDVSVTVIELGDGFLTLPETERTTRRWGTVCLTDADGNPIPLRSLPPGPGIALTAAPLPDTDGISLSLKRELLGAGTAFTEATTVKGHAVDALGVAPLDDRTSQCLFPAAVGRLLGRRVLLEAHLVCPIGRHHHVALLGPPGAEHD